MAKSDLTQFEGHVIDVGAGGFYKIKLQDKEVEVSAKICGKMKSRNIHVVTGDRVTVGFSPYDLTIGLIMYRHR